jgi:predicted metal-dependent phosphoesterase TrpH
MFLGDFHIHSTFSDGKLDVPQIVELYGQRGFGAIAITDHLCESDTVLGKASSYLGCTLTPATFPIYLNILKTEAERAWDQYRMVVIPGVELTKNSISNHRSAHVLALGIHSYLSADGDVFDLTRSIRAQGALAVAAHPVWTRVIEKQTYHLWDRREELKEAFDAWEVASGHYLFEEVRKSNLPIIASSDFHRRAQLSSWKTCLEGERHPEAILQAIRRQALGYRYYQEEKAGDDPNRSRTHALEPIGRTYSLGNVVRATSDYPRASSF